MSKLIEGAWDCPYCGEKMIRGLKKECPICGKQRDSSTKFYMPNPKNYVKDEDLSKVTKDPDWLCTYCNSYNSSSLAECSVCGHSRDSEDSDYFQTRQEEDRKQEKLEKEYTSPPPPPPRTRLNKYFNNKKNIGLIAGIIAIISVIIGSVIFFITPIKDTVTIDNLTWEYVQPISHLIPVKENDWILPVGGRLERTALEIRSYKQVFDYYETKTRQVAEQVLDHYETVVTGHRDLGNGLFEEITSQQPVYRTEYRTETYEEPVYRQEPVYDTKYYYEIDKWVFARNITTSGDDKSPYVGEYTLADNERLDPLKTSYKVYMSSEDKSYTNDITESQWKTLNVGDILDVEIARIGNNVEFKFPENIN